ncbi:MAG: class C sortase [Solobacterium sp.]|jgi:sortase A|nr:class C sortase [Solobacterium sp.]MCH4049539.1 class C sortase [Solobacterium sp.]MCH4073223.1 class C sortase [Solobacterium sp.]MCI1314145.1 class C sortase [Solobacterium sp.]MCI1346872.1 class C sortase [Solobacterium sp.]
MRKHVRKAALAGFVLSALMILYPLLSNVCSDYRNKSVIQAYRESSLTDTERMLKEAQQYNRMFRVSDVLIRDQNRLDTEYEALLDSDGSGVMGYLEISGIDVHLPIYHYADAASLDKGIGHIYGSSLPVGGDSTHTILTGHRGLLDQMMLLNLDQVKIGDVFSLHVLDQVLIYEVDQIRVVKPEETELLKIEKGKDLATIVTCTPYAVNTERLLVTGHHIEKERNNKKRYFNIKIIVYYSTAAAVILFTLLILFIKNIKNKRQLY